MSRLRHDSGRYSGVRTNETNEGSKGPDNFRKRGTLTERAVTYGRSDGQYGSEGTSPNRRERQSKK